MNRNIIPIIVWLLFTLSFVSVALAVPQTLIWQLNQNHRAYTVPANEKLDEATLAAIKACQKVCSTSKMDAKACTMIDKTLKEKEHSTK